VIIIIFLNRFIDSKIFIISLILKSFTKCITEISHIFRFVKTCIVFNIQFINFYFEKQLFWITVSNVHK